MTNLGSYLLQMNCWLAAFWLVYIIFLKKETFFRTNRWFLNSGLLFSFLLPLLPIRYNIQSISYPITAIPTPIIQDQIVETAPTINYLLLIYILGVLIFLSRIIIQQLRLYRLQKQSEITLIENFKVFRIAKKITPFSFINTIYISNTLSNSTELETVVAHERIHIEERHWVDLLFMEMARTLQWFNPLPLLYRKAIMQNHEYLADSGTIDRGVSARTYKAILVNQMLGMPIVNFANSFTKYNSNNRILMMKKDKSTPLSRLKLLFILPLTLLLMASFAKPNYVTEQSTTLSEKAKTIHVKGVVKDENNQPLPGASILVKNTVHGTMANMNGEFTLDKVNPGDKIVVSFIGYETIAIPATKKMVFNMKKEVISISIRQEKSTLKPKLETTLDKVADDKKPHIVIDGEIKKGDLDQIDPETIQSMNVIKGPSATDKYGEKAKNGAIEITTKKENKDSDDKVFVIVEEMPVYPGGPKAIENYITQQTSNSKIKGRTYVTFTVNTDGKPIDIKVIRTTSDKLNDRSIKIIENMPQWTPGKQRGKPVKVSYTVPLEFH